MTPDATRDLRAGTDDQIDKVQEKWIGQRATASQGGLAREELDEDEPSRPEVEEEVEEEEDEDEEGEDESEEESSVGGPSSGSEYVAPDDSGPESDSD